MVQEGALTALASVADSSQVFFSIVVIIVDFLSMEDLIGL